MDTFKLTLSVLGIIAFLLIAYYGSRWLTKKVSYRSSEVIKILERAPLGPDKALIIVKVGSKCMLLSTSQQHVEKIDDLDADEIEGLLNKPKTQPPTFSNALSTVISQKFKGKGGGYNDKN